MTRSAPPLPDALSTAPFLASDLTRLGVPRSRVRGRDVARLGPGLYAHRNAEVTEAGVAAALKRKFPGSILAGPTAARLLRIPLPTGMDSWTPGDRVHLACAPGDSRSTAAGVQWERTVVSADDRVQFQLAHTLQRPPSAEEWWRFEAEGMSRRRLWISICRHVPMDWRVIVADHLLRQPRPWAGDLHRRPHATVDDLTAILERLAGYRGVGLAREALQLAREGTDSPQETRLRLALHWAGLPEPVLNPKLALGSDGSWIEPDLFFPDYGLVVEYDGQPHFDGDAPSRGQARTLRLRRAGFTDVHVFRSDLGKTRVGMSDAQVRAALEGSRAVSVVASELLHRGWRPTLSVRARLQRLFPELHPHLR